MDRDTQDKALVARLDGLFHLADDPADLFAMEIAIEPISRFNTFVRAFSARPADNHCAHPTENYPRFDGRLFADGVAKIEAIYGRRLSPGQGFGAKALKSLLSLDDTIREVWLVPIDNSGLLEPAKHALVNHPANAGLGWGDPRSAVDLHSVDFEESAIPLINSMIRAGVTQLEVAFESDRSRDIALRGRAPSSPAVTAGSDVDQTPTPRPNGFRPG